MKERYTKIKYNRPKQNEGYRNKEKERKKERKEERENDRD